jgi:hypothetical protein
MEANKSTPSALARSTRLKSCARVRPAKTPAFFRACCGAEMLSMRVPIPCESAAVRLMPHCSIMASFQGRRLAGVPRCALNFSIGSP